VVRKGLHIGVPNGISNMYIPKRYGESKRQDCPFCGKKAIAENSQGVPVCIKHKSSALDLKCMCGGWLDVRKGKWGPYFNCMKCGNFSFAKGLAMNPKPVPREEDPDDLPKENKMKKGPIYRPLGGKRVIEITSDELDFYE
jgi:hypothetical protein